MSLNDVLTTNTDLNPHPIMQDIDLMLHESWCHSVNTPESHSDYLKLLTTTKNSDEYVAKFESAIQRIVENVQTIDDNLHICEVDTKDLLIANVNVIFAAINRLLKKIDELVVESQKNEYDTFRAMLLKVMGQTEESLKSNSSLACMFETIIKLIYEPLKSAMMSTTHSEKDQNQILTQILSTLNMPLIPDKDSTKSKDMPIFTPRVIEVPASIIEESVAPHETDDQVPAQNLHMTSDEGVETPTPRSRKKSQAKDPVMGE